jgi:hypothetical protein
MHLKRDSACANDLPSFSSGEAWRTDCIKSASRGRQDWITGQGSLSCGLASGIDIKDDVAAPLAVPDAANGIVAPSFGKTGLLKERTKRFQTGTIHVSQEPAQAGAMGKTVPPKERHEGCPERNETLNEVGERAFSADGIANQHSEKIKRFIPAEASSHETDLMRESIKHLFLRQVASDDDDFSEPCRH